MKRIYIKQVENGYVVLFRHTDFDKQVYVRNTKVYMDMKDIVSDVMKFFVEKSKEAKYG